MSYEGRRQKWCQNGHYLESPEPYFFEEPKADDVCQICKAPFVFQNAVDDTNGDAHGYITPKELTPAIKCKCSCCGNVHVSTYATYEIPTTSTPRTFIDRCYDDGSGVRKNIEE